ncbi:MAG TPA: hypothetical protein VFI73_04335 [Candidatus Nitrosopolaris sp.]|nr:hypothetical protein [Candidatus Nitrosopolaris sp.]
MHPHGYGVVGTVIGCWMLSILTLSIDFILTGRMLVGVYAGRGWAEFISTFLYSFRQEGIQPLHNLLRHQRFLQLPALDDRNCFLWVNESTHVQHMILDENPTSAYGIKARHESIG